MYSNTLWFSSMDVRKYSSYPFVWYDYDVIILMADYTHVLLPGNTYREKFIRSRRSFVESTNLSNRIPGINYGRKVYYKSDHEIIQFIIAYLCIYIHVLCRILCNIFSRLVYHNADTRIHLQYIARWSNAFA